MRSFAIVVAADANRGIGKDNALVWRLPKDTAHFVRVTTETARPDARNAVVMGRKTWESIPPKYRPLGGRLNVVLTRRVDYDVPDGVLVAGSLDDALGSIPADIETVFVVGGAEIYADAVGRPGCTDVYYTRIDAVCDCDTFFPAFEEAFELAGVLDEVTTEQYPYRIEHWVRK